MINAWPATPPHRHGRAAQGSRAAAARAAARTAFPE